MFSGRKLIWFSILLLLSLYLVFPSGLSTGDSLYYAASIKYNNEIFLPHHLLYNSAGLCLSRITSLFGCDVLASLKVMNAFFAFFVLIILQKILFYLKCTDYQVVILTCLAGFSFSFMRYATENETYIVPLFFALLASYNYLKSTIREAPWSAFLSGLFAAISVLFHQIYIFWWIGLFAGFVLRRNKKYTLQYSVVSLIAPIAYLVVIAVNSGKLDPGNIYDFLSGDFSGNVRLQLTGKGILLSFVNSGRSFLQVHGYIINMIRENLLFLIPGLLSLLLFFAALVRFPKLNKTGDFSNFAAIHILILILQFLFAVFSSGNVEFMVMIPPLIFMLVPLFTTDYERFFTRILFGMIVWNLAYGLLPLHLKGQEPEQLLCDVAISEKKSILIVSDEQLIQSMLYYRTGENIFSNVHKSPAVLKLRGIDQNSLDSLIARTLLSGEKIYTNCLDEQLISRYSIMEGSVNHDFFQKYSALKLKTWKKLTGTRSIYQIKEKT
jgi:hypothetical protein